MRNEAKAIERAPNLDVSEPYLVVLAPVLVTLFCFDRTDRSGRYQLSRVLAIELLRTYTCYIHNVIIDQLKQLIEYVEQDQVASFAVVATLKNGRLAATWLAKDFTLLGGLEYVKHKVLSEKDQNKSETAESASVLREARPEGSEENGAD